MTRERPFAVGDRVTWSIHARHLRRAAAVITTHGDGPFIILDVRHTTSLRNDEPGQLVTIATQGGRATLLNVWFAHAEAAVQPM